MSNSSANDEDNAAEHLEDVRIELGLSEEMAAEALKMYNRVKFKFTLEGEQEVWLCIALYVALNTRPVEGERLSLTRILRAFEIKTDEFFSKMKNWLEMDGGSCELRIKLNLIEKKFNVVAVIFYKYRAIFQAIFKPYANLTSRFANNVRNRKPNRKQALNAHDVFTFCWSLFIYIKSHYVQISDDLVNSYHLLLVCIDYCFSAALSFDNFKEIINISFYMALSKRLDKDPKAYNNEIRVSIIDILCEQFYGSPMEMRQITEYWFKPLLRRNIERKELKKRESGISIMDPDVIDTNYKFIKKEYENFVLSIGEFDECLFGDENEDPELAGGEFAANLIEEQLRSAIQPPVLPSTPVTANQYLAHHTPCNIIYQKPNPIVSATQSVNRLQTIVMNCPTDGTPGPGLKHYFSLVKTKPAEKIAQMIDAMSDVFIENFTRDCMSSTPVRGAHEIEFVLDSSNKYAKERNDLAVRFFYYQLENILQYEIRIKGIPEEKVPDFLSILEVDSFLRSLFIISLEIVRFSYCSTARAFPWILNIFKNSPNLKVHPFNVYKIIEPFLRASRHLTRELVKHLSDMEEKILDTMAWATGSPVWQLLNQEKAPIYDEVRNNTQTGNHFATPFKGNNGSNLAAPVKPKLSIVKQEPQDPPQPKPIEANGADKDGKTSATQAADNKADQAVPSTPTKVQSKTVVRLFFRKVYTLASARLNLLCDKDNLNIPGDVVSKAWMCLEHAISNHTTLLCNHSLDHVIMCSIFAVCKLMLTNKDNFKFRDVVARYRRQAHVIDNVRFYLDGQFPEFQDKKSEGYRNLLIGVENPYTNVPPDRYTSDIVAYYNLIFFPRIKQEFFKSLMTSSETLLLSPMPQARQPSPKQSCLKITESIFISPLLHTNPLSPMRRNSMTIQYKNSMGISMTSKSLHEINEKVKYSPCKPQAKPAPVNNDPAVRSVSKRLLQDDQEEGNSKVFRGTRLMNEKILTIVSDRHRTMGLDDSNFAPSTPSQSSPSSSSTSSSILVAVSGGESSIVRTTATTNNIEQPMLVRQPVLSGVVINQPPPPPPPTIIPAQTQAPVNVGE